MHGESGEERKSTASKFFIGLKNRWESVLGKTENPLGVAAGRTSVVRAKEQVGRRKPCRREGAKEKREKEKG